VRFVDLLKTTVLLSAGSATLLGIITVAGASADRDTTLVIFAAAWWTVAALVGAVAGRPSRVMPSISHLLADAKSTTTLPEMRPALILVNRLWPLLLSTLAAAILGAFIPQVAAVATGFGLIWSLGWRHQDAAVAAIEDRDGATFYVERTSPVRPIRLVRAPGFRREVPSLNGAGGSA
jgi:hypothetical protein